jgi:hypothetical protein
MGLFNKRPAQAEHLVSYQEVVDFLEAMSDREYARIIKVVNIYRKANKDVEKILPHETLPPITILNVQDTQIGNFLDDEALPAIKPATKAKTKKS